MATGIRNVLMSIVAPFFATQGVLRTGIQVVLLKGWSEGREKVDSIFDSIGSLYDFGLPLLFVVLPFLTLLEPCFPGVCLCHFGAITCARRHRARCYGHYSNGI